MTLACTRLRSVFNDVSSLQVSVRVSDLQPAGTGKHRCTVSVFALPSVTVATGAAAPLTAISHPRISQTLEERDVATHSASTDSKQGQIIATLSFVYELILDVRKVPEGVICMHACMYDFQHCCSAIVARECSGWYLGSRRIYLQDPIIRASSLSVLS